MNHWSQKYIGKPWVNGARGPDAFDCWGLLWFIYKHELGIELPLYPGIDAKDKALVRDQILGRPACWVKLDRPEEFAGVALGISSFTHIGIYTEADGGYIIHAVEKHNVIAQRPAQFRDMGWAKMEFHKWLPL